jgi:Ca2+-binding RTX toxin-like protein
MALRKWGGETQVNTQLSGSQNSAAVASLLDGGFVVVWTDENPSGDGSSASIKMQRYGANGVKAGAETLVNTTTASSQNDPSIAVLENGSFIVSWRDDSSGFGSLQGLDVRYRRFDADGTPINLNDVALPYTKSQGDADVVSLNNGGFAISFVEYASSDNIFLDLFNSSGTLQLHVTVAATANHESIPAITQLVDDRILVTWTDYTSPNIRMQLVNETTGALIGTVINVPTGPVAPDNSSVLALSGGGFVVAWEDNSQPLPDNLNDTIRAKVYSSGSPPVAGAEFTINNLSLGDQGKPALAALPDGGFAAVYLSEGLGGANSRTMMQLFNADGGKRGSEYVVDTSSFSSDSVPDVSVLADGRIVVTWSATTAATSNNEILMQIIDPRDGLVNGTENNESLFGNDVFGDEINGYGGSDTLYGLAGDDALFGGDGEDFVHGERGNDTLYGGDSNDRLYGGAGDDVADGGAGDDTIFLGNGEDFADGGAEFDTLSYYSRALGAMIDMASQALNAGSALNHTFVNIERINGSDAGADTLRGDDNANYLVGYGALDTLIGNGGDDTLRGGVGADILTGGTGADKFRYDAVNEGGDTISSVSSLDDFQFVRTAFGNLAGANVAASAFLSRASGNAATTTDHRFIFDQATDTLWFDSNGAGAGGLTMIADIGANTTLTHLDLLLV